MKFRSSMIALVPCFFALALIVQAWFAQSSRAQEPEWYPRVVARGADRAKIKNTPMNDRPYRPMHFYGNTVRRNHYRGNPAPMPKDLFRTTTSLVFRR